MICWIVEEGRYEAVLLKEKRTVLPILGHKVPVFQQSQDFLLHLPHDFIVSHHEDPCFSTYRINDSAGRTSVLYLSPYDESYQVLITWKTKDRYTIGNAIDDDIYIQDNRLSSHQFTVDNHSHTITDTLGSDIGELDGEVLRSGQFETGSRFRVLNAVIVFSGDHIVSINSPGNLYVHMDELIDRPYLASNDSGFYLLSPPVYRMEPPAFSFHITLKDPLPFSVRQRSPLLFMIGPSLMMAAASLCSGILAAYQAWLNGREIHEFLPLLLLPAVMVVSVLIWTPMQRLYENRQIIAANKTRITSYLSYLEEVKGQIQNYQSHLRQWLEDNYPTIPEEDNFGRGQPFQKDFLFIRAGFAEQPFMLEVEQTFRCNAMDPLSELIESQLSPYRTISAPLVLSLKDVHHCSILYDEQCISMLYYLLYQLLFYYSSNVLHLILLADPAFIERHPFFREIPHCYGSYGIRMICSNQSEVNEIQRQLNEMEEEVVVLAQKLELLSFFDAGGSHVVSFSDRGIVPSNSELRIDLTKGMVEGTDIGPLRVTFESGERNWKEELEALTVRICSQATVYNEQSPSFSMLYGLYSCHGFSIRDAWETHTGRSSLSVPIGIGSDGEVIHLDLHEAGNGPHGLIAGMTGSGKSELIRTILLGLCVNYSPREFQFVMIDFKGGGAASLFSNHSYSISHCAGVVTNLDASDIDRTLVSFHNECLRRQELFHELGLSCGTSVSDLSQYQSLWKESYGLEYLPSLLILVDEFAELKREYPEFMKDLISIARIGRSLGIHLILSTQKPGGIVDDQIWSNTRFKLCLKVQEAQDSKEVLHCPDASFIRRPGEGYLLCDGILTRFQAGFTGAPSDGQRNDLSILDAMGHRTRTITMHKSASLTEAEELIRRILAEAVSKDVPHHLWKTIPETIGIDELNEGDGLRLGLLDDYYHTDVRPYVIADRLLAIYGMNREEKASFVQVLMYELIRNASKGEELFVIDDLHLLNGAMEKCHAVGGVVHSEEEASINVLFQHLQSSSYTLKTLVITDLSSLFEAEESMRELIHRCILHSEKWNLRLILLSSVSSVLAYRDRSMISVRIALNSTSLEERSAIFELPVHAGSNTKNTAYVAHENHLLAMRYPLIQEAELIGVMNEADERFQYRTPYTIPRIPEHLEVTAYSGNGIPLGMDTETFEWVDLPEDSNLFVISELPQERQGFYEAMKQAGLHPVKEEEINTSEDIKPILFLDEASFHRHGYVSDSIPYLFIGSGYQNQYRYVSNYRTLKPNQGILFQQHHARRIQLYEPTNNTATMAELSGHSETI